MQSNLFYCRNGERGRCFRSEKRLTYNGREARYSQTIQSCTYYVIYINYIACTQITNVKLYIYKTIYKTIIKMMDKIHVASVMKLKSVVTYIYY